MLQALSSLGEFITSQVVFLSITTVISLNPFSDDFHFVLSKNQICWSSIRFPVPWGPTYSFLNSALLYIHYVQEPVPGSARYSPKIQPCPCTQISPNRYPLMPWTGDQMPPADVEINPKRISSNHLVEYEGVQSLSFSINEPSPAEISQNSLITYWSCLPLPFLIPGTMGSSLPFPSDAFLASPHSVNLALACIPPPKPNLDSPQLSRQCLRVLLGWIESL